MDTDTLHLLPMVRQAMLCAGSEGGDVVSCLGNAVFDCGECFCISRSVDVCAALDECQVQVVGQ